MHLSMFVSLFCFFIAPFPFLSLALHAGHPISISISISICVSMPLSLSLCLSISFSISISLSVYVCLDISAFHLLTSIYASVSSYISLYILMSISISISILISLSLQLYLLLLLSLKPLRHLRLYLKLQLSLSLKTLSPISISFSIFPISISMSLSLKLLLKPLLPISLLNFASSCQLPGRDSSSRIPWCSSRLWPTRPGHGRSFQLAAGKGRALTETHLLHSYGSRHADTSNPRTQSLQALNSTRNKTNEAQTLSAGALTDLTAANRALQQRLMLEGLLSSPVVHPARHLGSIMLQGQDNVKCEHLPVSVS